MMASTIFSSIVGNCCGGGQVAGASEGSESLADSFVSGAFVPGGQIVMTGVSVEVEQELGFGGDPYFNVSLYTNVGGVPGSLISTLGTDLAAPAAGGLVTVSGLDVPLALGFEYWVVLTPYDSLSQVIWEQGGSSSGPTAFTTSTSGTSGWADPGPTNLQLEVYGSPVPEPESLVLVLSGVVGLAGAVRRRVGERRALQI